MSNVISISRAKSFAAPTEERWVDMNHLCHHLSISRSAAKNYVKGGFKKNGEFHPYPQGAIPHKRLPGGQLRFNLRSCEEWLDSGATSV